MNDIVLDVIVVGAGPAGLSASYYLTKYRMSHCVFERGQIGESWRSQRWDSFVLNTSNAINKLPGNYWTGKGSEEFAPVSEFAAALKSYAVNFQLPVIEHAAVNSVEMQEGGLFFVVKVSVKGYKRTYYGRQVIICSGTQNEKRVPAFAEKVSSRILQLHASEFKNSPQLPDGAVLVVGSGQSGCQIAGDLAANGRKVFLSTSLVPRVPRRYRGKDIMDWMITTKFFDIKREEIVDLSMLHLKAPQLTGTGDGRTTISLQSLAKKGVVLLGKMENAEENNLFFQPDAASHVQFADGFSEMVKKMIDEFILKNQSGSASAEEDPDDLPDSSLTALSSQASLNLNEQNIGSIIWTTGFGAGFNYIKLPVLDKEGNPKHQDGIAGIEGLYFLGLPWLRARKSSLIYGIVEDAEFITEKVYQQAKSQFENLRI